MFTFVKRSVSPLILSAGLLLSAGAVISPVLLGVDSASATVPAAVQTGIDDSVDTIEALSVLALSALTVALTPLGAMLTLRFLNMVLSRV
jgi:hypothetical protein